MANCFSIFFTINLVISFFVAGAADRKGRSFGGFLALSIFIGWVIPLIVVLVMAPQQKLPPVENGSQAKCPDCAELISTEAKVCKHCGKRLADNTYEI